MNMEKYEIKTNCKRSATALNRFIKKYPAMMGWYNDLFYMQLNKIEQLFYNNKTLNYIINEQPDGMKTIKIAVELYK